MLTPSGMYEMRCELGLRREGRGAQAESRVRRLEYQSAAQLFLPKTHKIVETGTSAYQRYLQTMKEEGKDHKRGSPELQTFSAVLPDLDHFLNEGSCPPELKKFIGLGQRLKSMMEHWSEIEASEWIRDFSFSPHIRQLDSSAHDIGQGRRPRRKERAAGGGVEQTAAVGMGRDTDRRIVRFVPPENPS
ncbi:unnamed protein product [Prorocentrum cordatum]|uniref:Uncharacterized protein n=1 Tax=Prorocentrum cordatum TaxID=2364126 RepID=A0ABN9PIN1_9DINO|nr:unnamed protein product [Polarella glacialis]